MAVLVPAVSGPAWTVGETWAGRRYLEDTARTVAVTLLTLTPENAARGPRGRRAHGASRRRAARSRRGWRPKPARLARRDLSSAFYPGGRRGGRAGELAAEVSGELVTWLGPQESTRERRRYRLVFAMQGGRIGLLRFEQREDGA